MRPSPFPLFVLLCCSSILSHVHALEDEFSVRGPEDLHKAALEVILDQRRANPPPRGEPQKDLFAEGSELFMKAKEYAIHRFLTKPDEALKLSVRYKHMCQCPGMSYPVMSIYGHQH